MLDFFQLLERLANVPLATVPHLRVPDIALEEPYRVVAGAMRARVTIKELAEEPSAPDVPEARRQAQQHRERAREAQAAQLVRQFKPPHRRTPPAPAPPPVMGEYYRVGQTD